MADERDDSGSDAPPPPRRPRPVRDVAEGASRPRPVAPRPARPRRATGRDDDRRPTPVRAAMGLARDDAPPLEAPRRDVELGSEREAWVVRLEGRGATGQPPDPGAPLLFLTFARAEDPDARLREVIAVGRALDDLSLEELDGLLARSRPLSPKVEPEEIFPGTRRGRGGRGGR